LWWILDIGIIGIVSICIIIDICIWKLCSVPLFLLHWIAPPFILLYYPAYVCLGHLWFQFWLGK
jgi:hypothetical protein